MFGKAYEYGKLKRAMIDPQAFHELLLVLIYTKSQIYLASKIVVCVPGLTLTLVQFTPLMPTSLIGLTSQSCQTIFYPDNSNDINVICCTKYTVAPCHLRNNCI